MSVFPGFYEAGPLAQVAINLFYGWGYNLFRDENKLRADSLIVRSKVSDILGLAARSAKTAEAQYREENIPPPTRATPYPDPAALAGARTLEAIGREIRRIEAMIRSAPAPETDRIMQRYRKERDLLQKLVVVDQELAGKADILRVALENKNGQWFIDHQAETKAALVSFVETIDKRNGLLAV